MILQLTPARACSVQRLSHEFLLNQGVHYLFRPWTNGGPPGPCSESLFYTKVLIFYIFQTRKCLSGYQLYRVKISTKVDHKRNL